MTAKNKWADFKANSSNLNVATPNMGSSNLQLDWYRAAKGEDPININGVPLKKIADHFNQFETEADVLRFFEKAILRDFTGNKEDKENAVNYLKKSFHQGGFLYPVSSALATELKGVDGKTMCSLSDQYRDNHVNIQTTSTGFKIQEYADAKALTPFDDSLMKYAPEGRIYPEQGKDSIIKAEATIAIDFSKNSNNPSLAVESNHMEISHEGVKSHLDNRSLGQKIVDYVKNFLGLDQVKDISPPTSAKEIEVENTNTDDVKNKMTL